MDSQTVIEANGLTKTFWVNRHRSGALGALRGLVDRSGREVKAVENISFRLRRGEIVGFIGPNGAGKSTTIKMLTGILVPSGGEATVDGIVPWQQRKRLASRIGVVFGQRTQLWWDLPLIESLELLRHVYRVPADRFGQNLERFRALLDLDAFLETPVRQLSLGQRMRGDLAAALLHDPSILYLDEPTIGLDVVAKARIRAFLAEINRERAVTILLTTHDLADIEHLCRRIVIIDHGRLLYDGEIEEIRGRFGTQRTLVADIDVNPDDKPADHSLPGVTLVKHDGPRHWFRFNRGEASAADVIAMVAARYRLLDVTIEEPEIEEIVRRIYEEGFEQAGCLPPVLPLGGGSRAGVS